MVVEDDRHFALVGGGTGQPGPRKGQFGHRFGSAGDRDHVWYDGSGEIVDPIDLSGSQEFSDEGTVEFRLGGLGGNVHRPHTLGLPCRQRGVGGQGVQHAHPKFRIGVRVGRYAGGHGHAVDVDQGVDDAVAIIVA